MEIGLKYVKKGCILLTIYFLGSACVPTLSTEESRVQEPGFSNTNGTLTQTAVIAETKLLPSEVLTFTATPYASSETHDNGQEWIDFAVESQCVDEKSSLTNTSIEPNEFIFTFIGDKDGIWRASREIEDSVLVFPSKRENTFYISPGGTQTVFTNLNEDPPKIIVNSLIDDGQVEFDWSADWPEPKTWGIPWFSNQWLRLYTSDALLLISPQTGNIERTFIFPKYSDLPTDDQLWSVNNILTRVAYQDVDSQFALRDLDGEEIVTQSGVFMHWFNFPSWSPDSSFFLFEGIEQSDQSLMLNELYIFDNKGEGGRISDFSSYFKEFTITIMDWSPNQRYIAIWALSTLNEQSARKTKGIRSLYVLDLDKSLLIDVCIQGETVGYQDTSFGFLWSQDSGLLYSKLHNDTPGLIINIESGAVIELPLDISIIAWSKPSEE